MRSLQEQELEQTERDADVKEKNNTDNSGSRGGRPLGREGCGDTYKDLRLEKVRRQEEQMKPCVKEHTLGEQVWTGHPCRNVQVLP